MISVRRSATLAIGAFLTTVAAILATAPQGFGIA